MCLAVPGKITEIKGEEAVIEFGGVSRRAIISMVPDLKIGDYVLIHAGFAIQKWSEQDVKEFEEVMKDLPY